MTHLVGTSLCRGRAEKKTATFCKKCHRDVLDRSAARAVLLGIGLLGAARPRVGLLDVAARGAAHDTARRHL